ncbi:hypothetical protein [Flavivirga jejuensis]|uniref:Uncharacterized protein n=1 Tax=Flavivirga jejuensis TaxID=870487 RepID=A0ABT8WNM4_9FLAO|nr:hypothetical protein [Flavivirga jejuensis]MDO5974777.1 hypothetical protein [Flavivirga jejuensis]
MDIASRFFLIQKSPNGHGYVTKVCRGINGLEKKSKKDYTILEAVLYDAIYNRVVDEKKDEAEFLNSLYKYIEDITEKEDNIEIIRQYIFSSMASDENLNNFIFSYLEKNKDNIPFEVE